MQTRGLLFQSSLIDAALLLMYHYECALGLALVAVVFVVDNNTIIYDNECARTTIARAWLSIYCTGVAVEVPTNYTVHFWIS